MTVVVTKPPIAKMLELFKSLAVQAKQLEESDMPETYIRILVQNADLFERDSDNISTYINVTNVTPCNTELSHKEKVVSYVCGNSCIMDWPPMLHLRRAQKCNVVTFVNATKGCASTSSGRRGNSDHLLSCAECQ